MAVTFAAIALGACERRDASPVATSTATPIVATQPTPVATATERFAEPAPGSTPRRDPLAGGPYPTLLVAQAQFTDVVQPDGSSKPVPGPAKLLIVRRTPDGWETLTIEDLESNAFHKAIPYNDGILTIGGSQARLKEWHYRGGKWRDDTRWNATFGGKLNRLRDVEIGNPDAYGGDDVIIGTHDQGAIAAIQPEQGWRPERIDSQKDTFVHEIELGDIDGDGRQEIFATPSKPNTLEQEQAGEVTMYERVGANWKRSVVDAPGDTHAKEILAADVDGDGTSELFVVWEGAIGAGGAVVRPVTIKQYRMRDGKFASTVVANVPDRQMRALVAGDVDGDGTIDLVGGAMTSGLWLFQQAGAPTAEWKKTLIDAHSTGFEHPVHLADLDGDGALEIYVASEDQHELRAYRWKDGAFAKEVVIQLTPGDITWNVASGQL